MYAHHSIYPYLKTQEEKYSNGEYFPSDLNFPIMREAWPIVADYIRANYNFYDQLDLINDSEVLVAAARSFSTRFDVEFLTALPRESTMPSARDDKTAWLARHFPGVPINFGPFSRDKQKWFKTAGDILIDDKPSNVEEWHAAGGIAIYHRGDFAKTINLLYYAVDKERPMLLT